MEIPPGTGTLADGFAVQIETSNRILSVDSDGDNIEDWDDNCPMDLNGNQADGDNDGRGDICECTDGDDDGYCVELDCDDTWEFESGDIFYKRIEYRRQNTEYRSPTPFSHSLCE